MEAREFESGDVQGEDLRVRRLRAEHSLTSLLELNRELSARFEPRQVVDLVLFNLIGHLGTRQVALWLVDRSGTSGLGLARAHGIAAGTLSPITAVLAGSVEDWPTGSRRPARVEDGGELFGRDGMARMSAAGLALVGALQAHGAIIGFMALGRRADGERWSELDCDVFQASLGVAGVAIENSRLFHELEERNRRLDEALSDLRELDRMKTEFVQNVNHELRTPITVLSGAIDCLLSLPGADERQHGLHVAIANQTQRLAVMVQSILDLGILAGHDGAPLESVDPADFIERYAFERSGRVSNAGHALKVRTAPAGELAVRVQPVQLTKALDLLLDNALKFTPAGCTITISVAPDPLDPASACILFADDGPGIPAEHAERVFRPFYQVDGSATRAAGGLGIGLAVARGLLVAMGGRIDLEPRERAGGAVFRIQLRRG